VTGHLAIDLSCRSLHGRPDALHSIERIAHGAIALLGSIEGAARGFGAGFRVVGHLFIETVSSSTADDVFVIS